jgi:DNA polymerase V
MTEPTQRRTTLSAGFGGSYDEYAGDILSLDKLLVQSPASTYYMRVSGENAGVRIEDGDIVVVDKAIEPKSDQIIVAIIDAKFVIRRIIIKNDCVELYKDDHKPSETISEDELQVWGVVTASITQHRFKS